MELQLGAVERVRTLYAKFLEWAPAHCGAWCKFAELERSLGELDRARSIYELAIAQPLLDMPEVLWKVRMLPPPVQARPVRRTDSWLAASFGMVMRAMLEPWNLLLP